MRPLAINLLHRRRAGWLSWGPWWPRWLLLAALGCGVAADQALRIVALRGQLRAVAKQAYALPELSAPVEPAASAARPPIDLDDARVVAAMAAFDVAGALKALESLREPGLRVASAVIDARERRIRVDIEVSDVAQVGAALSALNAGEPAPAWRLVQAQAAATGQPARATLEMRR